MKACTSHPLPPLLASTPHPAGLLSLVRAPHLLCRHRPLPRRAPAALAGATAKLRHLRRLLGFRPAQPRPRCVTSGLGVSAHSPPAALPPGGSSVWILRSVLAVSSCRTYSLPASRGEFHLRRSNLCNREAAPGRGGERRVNWKVGHGLGSGCQCPLHTTRWWEREVTSLQRFC